MKYLLRSHAALRMKLYHRMTKKLGLSRELHRDNLPQLDYQPLRKVPAFTEHSETAETIIKDAYLGKNTEPISIAINNKHIVAKGNAKEIANFYSEKTKVISAAGKRVIPAFTDSHLHLLVGAERIYGCNLEGCKTFEKMSKLIKEFSKNNPDLPVIHAYGLAYTTPSLLPARTARKLLDNVISEKPLFIYAHDLHTGWANTIALKETNMFEKMPPWPPLLQELEMTDNITLGDDGKPGGELREPETYFLVEGSLRAKYPLTPEQKLTGLRCICEKMHENGITGVHTMGLALPEEDIETLLLLLELEQKGQLSLRVNCSISVVPDENMLNDIERAAKVRNLLRETREGRLTYARLHSQLIDILEAATHPRQQHISMKYHESILERLIHNLSQHIHIAHSKGHRKRRDQVISDSKEKFLPSYGLVECNCIKIFLDGVVEKDTAYRSDQKPLESIPAFSPEILEEVICLADRSGLQIAAHCIGDASVNMVLNAVSAARKQNAELDRKRGHRIRHRIEHIELCQPEDIKRFAKLGVTASMQPLHERPPVQLWHQKIPQSSWETAFPWRKLLDNDANLTFGSDWPIVTSDCLQGIKRATTRKPWKAYLPEANLSNEEAIKAFTAGAAYTVHEEEIRGKVAIGMLADMVILDNHSEKPLTDAAIYSTIFAGDEVYCKKTANT